MITDLIIGALIVVAIAAVWWVVTHHQPAAAASPKDLTSTVTAGLSEAWASVKADLPRLVETRVAELEVQLAAALQRAAKAEADLVTEQQAKQAALGAVATAGAALDNVRAQTASASAAPGFMEPKGAT